MPAQDARGPGSGIFPFNQVIRHKTPGSGGHRVEKGSLKTESKFQSHISTQSSCRPPTVHHRFAGLTPLAWGPISYSPETGCYCLLLPHFLPQNSKRPNTYGTSCLSQHLLLIANLWFDIFSSLTRGKMNPSRKARACARPGLRGVRPAVLLCSHTALHRFPHQQHRHIPPPHNWGPPPLMCSCSSQSKCKMQVAGSSQGSGPRGPGWD